MIEDQLKEYGLLFRKTIESMPISEFPQSWWFSNYPKGCCGDTCHLFSKFLKSKDIIVSYVWGMRKEQSHAWLEYDDIIIDLTADQFRGVKEKVIITRNKDWHCRFKICNREISDFIYRNIASRLEKVKEESLRG